MYFRSNTMLFSVPANYPFINLGYLPLKKHKNRATAVTLFVLFQYGIFVRSELESEEQFSV